MKAKSHSPLGVPAGTESGTMAR